MDTWSLGVSDFAVVLTECLNAHRDLDRNARRFFPGLYEEQVRAPKRERSDSSILIIDAQEEMTISATPRGDVGELLIEHAVGSTGRKRRKTQRAREADVGNVRSARQQGAGNMRKKSVANPRDQGVANTQNQVVRAHANKENLSRRNGGAHSGWVVPPEKAASKSGEVTAGEKSQRSPRKKRRTVSCADLRADIKMMAVPITKAIGRLSQTELTQAIIHHIPQMTVAQLIQACDKKRLSLEKMPRAPKKKDYVALLVNHYVDS